MAHVEKNSGKIEWYTPPYLIEKARATMGSIDCDPCTSELAQRYIKAATYYTKITNGLDKKWQGNVWVQPPYHRELIQSFVAVLSSQIGTGYCKQFTGLTNNGTETKAGQQLLRLSFAACFPAKRISFLDEKGAEANKPLQGQIIWYRGPSTERFKEQFNDVGEVKIWGGM